MEAGFLLKLNDIITFDCPPALIEERGARPSDPAPRPEEPTPKPREEVVVVVLSPAKRPPPPPTPIPPLAVPEPGTVRRAAFFMLYNNKKCIHTASPTA